MLLQRGNGGVGLPSVFSHCSRCDSGTESPGLSRRNSTRNRQSFATAAALKWTSMDKFLSPAKEVANGTSGSLELGCFRRPGRELGRESLSPAHPHRDWSTSRQQSSGVRDSGALGPTQPLARSRQSLSERDLRAHFLERVQKEAELAAFLEEADREPRGEMKELRKLDVDLNMMMFELLSLKQRMESSFAVLEKEKTWLEMLSSGGRKRKWKRKDKVFPLKLELLKAKSYSGRRRNGLLSQDSGQKEDKMPGIEPGNFCTPSRGSSTQPQPSGVVPLEPEHAWKKQEGPDVPVGALGAGRVGGKSQVNQEDPEKVLLKHKLDSAEQANRELSLAVAESRQKLVASSDSLRHSEAEKKQLETHLQTLEDERVQLLGEREGRTPEGRPDGPSRDEELNALQVTCDNLRESQSLLQREKDLSETRCRELEAALRGQWEEMERHLAEQREASQDWQERWEQLATALKAKEEELEEAHLRSQASSAQSQLDACKQELEENRGQDPRRYVQRREAGSQTSTVPTSETALREADLEMALLREELQKAQDMLKSRDAQLEGKELELETARNQCAECRSEKHRVDQLVASLEERLAEKEQALRHLEEAGNEDRAEKETKISLLEQKLAETEAVRDLPRRGSDTALETLEVRGDVPGEDSRSGGTCRHCSAALTQLDQAIQSAERREKEDRTLACLYRLRELLKGSPSSDWAPVPKLAQSPSRDPAAKVTQSPWEEKEMLRQRHQLVTEQLKGLFRQRQELEQSRKPPGGGKEERPREPRTPQEVLAAPESARPPGEQPAAPDAPSDSAEVRRLRQLLKEKTETISSMVSEIQSLQQKNESLMKAKLRFQQQIQQIRNLPKQQPERSALELPVPRLSVTLGQDSHSAQGSDSSPPSPQSDEPPFTGSREDLSQPLRGSQPHAGAEDQQRGGSPPSATIPAGSSSKPFSLELPLDSEGALASPRGSALLSPRPFGGPRPWSPFRFRGSPEPPEGGEKR